MRTKTSDTSYCKKNIKDYYAKMVPKGADHIFRNFAIKYYSDLYAELEDLKEKIQDPEELEWSVLKSLLSDYEHKSKSLIRRTAFRILTQTERNK